MLISASRRTDIPALFADWFYQRIAEQYVLVRNPVNQHQVSRISLTPDVVDGIVFWTKNPTPMLSGLDKLAGYPYYFQFTCNGYGPEIEGKLSAQREEIQTAFFILADKIGPQRIIWRYDPILLSQDYTMDYHVRQFDTLCNRLKKCTATCTISFLDGYRHINSRLARLGVMPLSAKQMNLLAGQLAAVADAHGITVSSCAEEINLTQLGIGHGRCIDAKMFENIAGIPLQVGKDPYQRPACGCAASVDIGAYNTCTNQCCYCYANRSDTQVQQSAAGYSVNSPLLCSRLHENDIVRRRPAASHQDAQLRFD